MSGVVLLLFGFFSSLIEWYLVFFGFDNFIRLVWERRGYSVGVLRYDELYWWYFNSWHPYKCEKLTIEWPYKQQPFCPLKPSCFIGVGRLLSEIICHIYPPEKGKSQPYLQKGLIVRVVWMARLQSLGFSGTPKDMGPLSHAISIPPP